MDILSWLSILNILVLLFSLYQVSTILSERRSAYIILICMALLSYLISNIVFLGDNTLSSTIRFVNLTALVCILSALFSLIRESKPIFARFPPILSYLPFITLLFIPLVLENTVIYNLLLGTFQGGSILVATMIFILNKMNKKESRWQISGCVLLIISFVVYWFSSLTLVPELIITEVLLLTGILFVIIGTKKSKNKI